jgi:AraC family transcriptional regulator
MRVFDYIDAHIGEDLSLDQLCEVAAFSRFHFARQFTALFGISPLRYIHLVRMKRAGHQLVYRPNLTVTDIALDCGYDSPEAFARAFKTLHGQSPSSFRDHPNWGEWHALYDPLDKIRRQSMPETSTMPDVEITEFPETHTVAIEHHGPPELLGKTIGTFIAWRKKNALPPSKCATFNIVYNDPETVDPADYRIAICAQTRHPLTTGDQSQGIFELIIPAGRCAHIRHIGTDARLRDTLTRLYRDWLGQRGVTLRDFPLIFQHKRFFPDVAEHEKEVDVFLPLE